MTTIKVRRVAVLGAGTRGSQIPGYLGDVGLQVDMFDLPRVANRAWDGLVKAGSCTYKGRQNVTPRVMGQDDAVLANADLIVDAVLPMVHSRPGGAVAPVLYMSPPCCC